MTLDQALAEIIKIILLLCIAFELRSWEIPEEDEDE